MYKYTNVEMADIHFTYGLADGNAQAARPMYQEGYPQRVVPNVQTFIIIHGGLCETGSFKKGNRCVRNTCGSSNNCD